MDWPDFTPVIERVCGIETSGPVDVHLVRRTDAELIYRVACGNSSTLVRLILDGR
jgi:hypothetical protein